MNQPPSSLSSSFTFKELLLGKLSNSVICSVLSQLVILKLYVFILNFNLFHPLEWYLSTLRTFTSVSTWIFILPFLTIIFFQSLICAKHYVLKTSYCSTRFQKFLSLFTIRNFMILMLSVLAGVMLLWLLLYLEGEDLYRTHAVYILGNGFWHGVYFFSAVYGSEKQLNFPVIHKPKFLQFKTEIVPLLKKSFWMSVTPTLMYILIFFIWGNTLTSSLNGYFGWELSNKMSMFVYFYSWIFGVIYCFNMNLMQFFFNLFLTEPVEFPLVVQKDDPLCLPNNINNVEWPIVQHLACLDLCNLAQWSQIRRKVFFTLSQPGGHPHNWNALIENVLKLFNNYISLLEKSTNIIKATPKPLPQFQMQSPLYQRPVNKYSNMRNMSLVPNEEEVSVQVTYLHTWIFSLPAKIIKKIQEKLNNLLSFIKIVLRINYFFGELPQANIQKFLSDGYLIIWTSQGISDLVCASRNEDPYGVVHKDLPAIIRTLVRLKQQLDELNKVSIITRKRIGPEDFYFKMASAISSTIKRSLFHICTTFDDGHFTLLFNKDVMSQLQPLYKN